MKNLGQPRYVVGIDPSGNFYEGKGITGYCIFDRWDDKVVHSGSIKASEYKTQLRYWDAHLRLCFPLLKNGNKFVVSMEDYVLYSRQAKAQINSAMETSQLIGVLKMYYWSKNIPMYIRTASHVKKRWADNILCNKGYIRKVNSSYFADCKDKVLCEHERDAIRHALHCATFELGKEKKHND